MIDFEALDALWQAATPGPWGRKTRDTGEIVLTAYDPEDPHEPWCLADMVKGSTYDGVDPINHNVESIIALHNAWPAILCELRAGRARAASAKRRDPGHSQRHGLTCLACDLKDAITTLYDDLAATPGKVPHV